jgi:hypothetical protein
MKPKPKDIDVDPRNRRPTLRAIPTQILNAAEPLLELPAGAEPDQEAGDQGTGERKEST